MGLVRAVALNTFREAVRDRVFYNLLLFAVLLVGASLVIGQLAAGQDVKIIKDLGLAASLLFGVGIAVFIGIQLVAREVERRSVHATLSKPVSRPTFLLGKYVGLLLTLGVNIVVMAVALFAVLAVYGALTPPGVQAIWTAPALDPRLLAALALIYVELAVVTAIALLFSTYSSALLSATFTSAIWVAGHFVGDLRAIEQVGASGATAWGHGWSRGCCRTSRCSTSRRKWCMACRSRQRRSWHRSATASCTAPPCCRSQSRSSSDGTSSDATPSLADRRLGPAGLGDAAADDDDPAASRA